jgi:hypothetical protein
MIAHEFQADVNPDGTLKLPEEVARRLPAGQRVRVLLLVAESEEDRDWQKLTTEQFIAGYSEADAIYDQLSAG